MPQPCKYQCRDDERPKCNDPSCVQFYVNKGMDVHPIETPRENAATEAQLMLREQLEASIRLEGADSWKEEI